MSDKPKFVVNVNPDEGFEAEQNGLHELDKILIGVCLAIFPASLGVFGSLSRLPPASKVYAILMICLNMPAVFSLLWHYVRWPVRLKKAEKIIEKGTAELAMKMGRQFEDFQEIIATEVTKKFREQPELFDSSGNCKYDFKEEVKRLANELSKEHMIKDDVEIAKEIKEGSRKLRQSRERVLNGKLSEPFATLRFVLDKSCQ